MTAALAVLCTASGAASSAITDHFKRGRVGEGQSVTFTFTGPKVHYAVAGDLSASVNESIDSYMTEIGKAIKVSPERSNRPDILMIYDSRVFDDLRSNRAKFLAAKIPQVALDVLTQQATAASWKSSCISFSFGDNFGHTAYAIVLSRDATSKCLSNALFDVFGVSTISDDKDGLLDLCVLYSLVRAGINPISVPDELLEQHVKNCKA